MSDEAKSTAQEIAELKERLATLEAQQPWTAHLKEALPKNWQQIVSWLLTALVTAIGAHYGVALVAPPGPVWQQEKDRDRAADKREEEKPWVRPADGWQHDQEQIDAVLDSLTFKVFADTPAGRADDPLPPAVYHWHAYTKLFARPPPSRDQGSVGSCVSFGTNTAIERTMAVAIALKGENFEYRDIVQEVTYAGSRVQIGQKRIRGDGSIGAWAAKFVKDYGIVPRGLVGKYDLTTYSISRCREWGNAGVPADLIPVSKEHPVQSITQVKTWLEAKKALASGYGIAVCSNVGFDGSRDKNGVKVARGSWAHCMALDGYHTDANGKEYGHIENSWGPRSNEGPVGWGDPPPSGFWVISSTIERMLAQGDSWAFSTIKGFPSQKLDWFVLHHPPGPGRGDGAFGGMHHAILLELRPGARPGPHRPSRRDRQGAGGGCTRPGQAAA